MFDPSPIQADTTDPLYFKGWPFLPAGGDVYEADAYARHR